jgi:DNA-directed RNA polymerase alpha subunit
MGTRVKLDIAKEQFQLRMQTDSRLKTDNFLMIRELKLINALQVIDEVTPSCEKSNTGFGS